jgi:FkbM family methyltransferase
LVLAKHGFDSFAIEGSAAVAKIGKINFILNDLPFENYIESWVVPSKDKKYFKHESDFSFTNHLSESGNEQINNVCLLSELLIKFNPAIIKLDLEGLDSTVLLNADVDLVSKLKYIVIEIEDGSIQSKLIEDHLFGLDFILKKKIGIDGKEVKNTRNLLTNFHFVNNT